MERRHQDVIPGGGPLLDRTDGERFRLHMRRVEEPASLSAFFEGVADQLEGVAPGGGGRSGPGRAPALRETCGASR